MANFSYNSSGATPPVPRPTMGGVSNTSSSPFSSALNNAANPAFGKGLSVASGGNVVSLPPIPAPSTPVKKTTVNNVDGSSHITEYHAPEVPGDKPGLINTKQSDGSYTATSSDTAPTQNPPQQTTFTTPSGARVDSQTGQMTSPGPTPSYPGLISTAAQGNAAIGQSAADIAAQYGKKIAEVGQQGAMGQAGQLTTGTSPVAEGNAAVTQQTTAERQTALAQGETAALAGTSQQLTGQSQLQSGLTAAGQLNTPANQFIQVPYSSQVIGADGKPVGGGSIGTLPQVAQDAINLQIQRVKSGLSTIGDAQSAISAYGQAGINALQKGLGSNFNVNASNASAGTTATGQQIQTAADSTNKALDTLSSAFMGLPAFQTGGIPATNSIAQWIGTALGDSALQQYKTNLADARSQLIGVLNSAGGTPTGNEATANQYLPDNMTVDQFKQNVGTAQNPGIVRQLIAQKVGAFTSSGQQNTSSNPSSAKEGESTSAGGYNFTYKNGQWIAQ